MCCTWGWGNSLVQGAPSPHSGTRRQRQEQSRAGHSPPHPTCALPVSGQPTWLLQLWSFTALLLFCRRKGGRNKVKKGRQGDKWPRDVLQAANLWCGSLGKAALLLGGGGGRAGSCPGSTRSRPGGTVQKRGRGRSKSSVSAHERVN